MICIDANVLVSAARHSEHGFATSVRLLARLHEDGLPLYSSVLLLSEVSGALARRTGQASRGLELVRYLRELPSLTLFALDEALAERAAEIAAACSIKGPDAVYVATAERAGATLITWDAEVVERASSVVRVEMPDQRLAAGA